MCRAERPGLVNKPDALATILCEPATRMARGCCQVHDKKSKRGNNNAHLHEWALRERCTWWPGQELKRRNVAGGLRQLQARELSRRVCMTLA